jgi:hypothetical protein
MVLQFLHGMKYRMGCQLQPNQVWLIGAIIHLVKLMKEDAQEAKEMGLTVVANELWKIAAYLCTMTAASLQGDEGFYLDLAGLHKLVHKGRTSVIPPGINKNTILLEEACVNLPHITICLLGKFKGETGIDHR